MGFFMAYSNEVYKLEPRNNFFNPEEKIPPLPSGLWPSVTYQAGQSMVAD